MQNLKRTYFEIPKILAPSPGGARRKILRQISRNMYHPFGTARGKMVGLGGLRERFVRKEDRRAGRGDSGLFTVFWHQGRRKVEARSLSPPCEAGCQGGEARPTRLNPVCDPIVNRSNVSRVPAKSNRPGGRGSRGNGTRRRPGRIDRDRTAVVNLCESSEIPRLPLREARFPAGPPDHRPGTERRGERLQRKRASPTTMGRAHSTTRRRNDPTSGHSASRRKDAPRLWVTT